MEEIRNFILKINWNGKEIKTQLDIIRLKINKKLNCCVQNIKTICVDKILLSMYACSKRKKNIVKTWLFNLSLFVTDLALTKGYHIVSKNIYYCCTLTASFF